MKSSGWRIVAGLGLLAGLVPAQLTQAGCHCRRADPCRGIAVTSPWECPDPCDSPVSGEYCYSPYYPGYAPDRRCLLLYGKSPWEHGTGSRGYGSGDYGALSGGRRDEKSLLRLGGNSRATPRTTVDVIDRIRGY